MDCLHRVALMSSLLVPVACDEAASTASMGGDVEVRDEVADEGLVAACFQTCFDEDPCTDDVCRADGQCVHVPWRAHEACISDAHCDDGNPCTDDLCAVDGCGYDRCEHLQRSGCQPCMFGCDDGDPCTVDLCGAGGICVADTARDPHCDPECDVQRASPIGVAFPEVGSVRHWYGVVDAEEPSCGACMCETDLVMGEGGEAVPLSYVPGAGEANWKCQVDGCEDFTRCTPLIAGVGYVAWGVVRSQHRMEQPPWDADSVATIKDLAVEGYCLSPRHEHLVGTYRGTFESQGRSATFSARITASPEGGLVATFDACGDCAELGLTTEVDLRVGDDQSRLDLPVQLADGVGTARLYPQRDAFKGDVVRDGGGFVGILTLARAE